LNKGRDVEIQRQYYAETACTYEARHVDEKDEHYFALNFMISTLDYYEIESVLDLGCGTGRAIRQIKSLRPDIRVLGVEPVQNLREVGYSLGLSPEELIDGDATNLQFATSSVDLVCCFGVLHHIAKPKKAIAEMLRVARKGIFISDSNGFGQGSLLARTFKQSLNAVGLWRTFHLIRTKGKGYAISKGDGLYYSYSVFNDYRFIKSACKKVHLLNTNDGDINPYRTASHIALLGVKK
jgi:ubiquinone/menaquinone biosynthesis C-methylase UbiE